MQYSAKSLPNNRAIIGLRLAPHLGNPASAKGRILLRESSQGESPGLRVRLEGSLKTHHDAYSLPANVYSLPANAYSLPANAYSLLANAYLLLANAYLLLANTYLLHYCVFVMGFLQPLMVFLRPSSLSLITELSP